MQPSGAEPQLQLRLPLAPASVEVARLAVRQHLQGQGVSDKALFRLELVLEEGVMNRVWHAYPAGWPPGDIGLRLRVLPEMLELCLEDEGVPFDPLAVADPSAPASLAEARPGGLGLMLVRKRVQAMRYEREHGRNRLTVEIARD